MADETIRGTLCKDVDLVITKTGKSIGKTIVFIGDPKQPDPPTTDFVPIIAWEVNGVNLSENYKKGSQLSLFGYYKFNDFTKKNEFVVKEILTENN